MTTYSKPIKPDQQQARDDAITVEWRLKNPINPDAKTSIKHRSLEKRRIHKPTK